MRIRRGRRGDGERVSASGLGARALGAVAATARALRGRRRWAAAAAGLLVLGVAGGLLFAGDDEPDNRPPETRAREYRDFDACLLTGADGITRDALAASVWEGMRRASGDTRARVTYVPVTGEQTVDNARPFVNGLVQRECEVVLAVGAPQVRAASAVVGRHPELRFVLVDGAVEAAADNVAVVRPGGEVPEAVAEEIRGAVRDAGM